MAIKGGDLLHVGNQVLIERAQTAGPGTLNIPNERIYELGNYLSLAILRDIPDLSFSAESLDASAAMEAMLVNQDFSGMSAGTSIDLSTAVPLDVASEFKAGRTATSPYNVMTSVGMPYLTLESMSYRYGLRDKAAQTATLKGDSIFYNAGSTYIQEAAGTNVAAQDITVGHVVFPFTGDPLTGTRYALGVTTSTGKRLVYGIDYTEVVTGSNADTSRTVHVILTDALPTTDKVRITYSSPVVAAYPQISHTVDSVVKPAAIRGRDITVYVNGESVGDKWTSVQAVTADYRVTLDRNEEFGNYLVVSQDFDIPQVSGSIQLRPRDPVELYKKVAQIAGGVGANDSVGAYKYIDVELLIKLHSPIDGSVLKCLYVPDATFDLPGYSGRVQQKLDVTINWNSVSGTLGVIKGDKP